MGEFTADLALIRLGDRPGSEPMLVKWDFPGFRILFSVFLAPARTLDGFHCPSLPAGDGLS